MTLCAWPPREIRHLRNCVLNWSQATFAAALDVNKATVARWETGACAPWPRHRLAIARLAVEAARKLQEAA